LPIEQENRKVENLREGEAPAEPKGLQNTAQQELCHPIFALCNDFATLLVHRTCRLTRRRIHATIVVN
jgi:hypothetical protein